MLAPYELGGTAELRATGRKVVVEPEPAPERLVHVVKDRDDSFRIGRILSMGIEAADKLRELKVGDRVLYAQSVACTTAVTKRDKAGSSKARHIVDHEAILCGVQEGAETVELTSSARVCAPVPL
jgi:hypothetical protein